MAHDSTTQLQIWIDRMKAGDETARRELINHAYDRLQRLTRKMLADFSRVRPWEETGDVLHQSLERLVKALEAVPVESVAEFFRLATRQIRWELLDLARKYQHWVRVGAGQTGFDFDTGQEQRTPPGVDPGTTTLDPENLTFWTEFHQRVDQLPGEERDVFELRWYQGLTREETAGAMGVSEAKVGRLWLAARLKLAAYLRPEEAPPAPSPSQEVKP